MRFMMFVYPGGDDSDGDYGPPPVELVEAMSKFNEELTKAGVLLALDGLHPPSAGARVSFAGGKPTVTDGPFAEAREVIGGYWTIDVKSRDEAIAWAGKAPMQDGDTIEVRRVQEMSEMPEDVAEAAQLSELPPEQTSAS